MTIEPVRGEYRVYSWSARPGRPTDELSKTLVESFLSPEEAQLAYPAADVLARSRPVPRLRDPSPTRRSLPNIDDFDHSEP